ncbi:MAG: ABC transporter permease [Cytophagales bacterium]
MRKFNLGIIISIIFLVLWIVLGLFSELISSEKPLYYIEDGKSYFPIIEQESLRDYKSQKHEAVIWPPIPFSSSSMDMQNTGSKAPGVMENRIGGNFKHLLGTDHLGRDVTAGLIAGANVSLKIVFYSLLLSAVFGILIGLITGYFGDQGLKVRFPNLFLIFSLFLTLIFHSSESGIMSLSFIIWLLICFILYFLLRSIPFKLFNSKKSLPLDLLIWRILEIFDSIPKILLLIAIFAGYSPSLERVIILIALISWPGISKIVRAETLSEKNKNYIEAGKALGFKNSRLILIHILPNIIAPISVYLTFFAGSIILIESSLSFLGLGMPPDVQTWGRMLALAKNHLSSWWLVFFPGFFIFASVYSLNTLGRYLSSKIQYRKQQNLLI